MSNLKVAAQLYTLRDFLKTPEEIEKTLKKVKEIGYDAVQLSGMGPIEAEALKKIADEVGLEICATHISYDRLQNDLDKVIAEHKLWNCKYVGLGGMPMECRTSYEGYKEFLKTASEIAKKLNDNGLRFIYHNHRFEFEKFNGLTGMDILFNETDPETFEFELDTYWVQAGGANPIDWINKVSGRMSVVHFKDMAIKDDQQIMAEIGEGNLNWPAIIEACKKNNVKWCAVEQDICQRDPFESLEISRSYLKKMGL